MPGGSGRSGPGSARTRRAWLRSQGEPVPEDPADEAWLAVEALSVMLDALADTVPPFLMQAMLAQQAGEEVTEAAELMLRSGHPKPQDIAARLTGRPALAADERPGVREAQPSGRSGAFWRYRPVIRRAGTAPGVRRAGVPAQDHAARSVETAGMAAVLVPADVTLRDLHGVIQQAMGWEDCHMHVFSTGWQEYGSPDPELGHAGDRKVRLSQILTGPGDRLRYTYDFGDGWEHDIVVEETRPAVPGETYPSLCGGQGCVPARGLRRGVGLRRA